MESFCHYLSSLSQNSITSLEQEMASQIRSCCEEAAKRGYGGIKINMIHLFLSATGVDDFIAKDDIDHCRSIVDSFLKRNFEKKPIWKDNVVTITWKENEPISFYLFP